MTGDEVADKRKWLLERLRVLQLNGDAEVAHYAADNALLDYIDDAEVREAFAKIKRWYA